MLGFLGNILSAIEDFPSLIVSGLDVVINGFFLAISEFLGLLFGLLPSMSDAPSIGGGDWLGWLNWFYPIGDLVIGVTGLITMYLIFMAVRYMLSLVRAL